MSQEDELMEIYQEVESKGLRKKFDKQLKKMRGQSKHLHKTACEMWGYALNRIKK
jgi:hypothetical protein|tara:strand:+ start:375 stop:539 length:165 start_codon:yes stop_codon:yes gene_type:complete